MKILVKIGGSLLSSAESRSRLAKELAALIRQNSRVVVVHGGGTQMTQFLTERGIQSKFVNGLRVTTPEVLEAVLHVVAGSVNHQLVAALVSAGLDAVGLSGIDACLTETEALSAELGAVGRPLRSNPALLNLLTSNGYLPVIACVGGDRQGRVFNVNADQMAVSCAVGFNAQKLFFLTDVDGVRGPDDQILDELTPEHSEQLIQQGIATGGMQAKLEAAMHALRQGVAEVVIAPGATAGVLDKLMARTVSIGTRLSPQGATA